MKAFFAIIAGSLIMASAPALSVPTEAGKSKSDETSSAKKKSGPANTKYCLNYEAPTGSHISQRECKTRAQWAAEGVDIDKV